MPRADVVPGSGQTESDGYGGERAREAGFPPLRLDAKSARHLSTDTGALAAGGLGETRARLLLARAVISSAMNRNSQAGKNAVPSPNPGRGGVWLSPPHSECGDPGSNPAALTKPFDLYGPIPGIDNPLLGAVFDAKTGLPTRTTTR